MKYARYDAPPGNLALMIASVQKVHPTYTYISTISTLTDVNKNQTGARLLFVDLNIHGTSARTVDVTNAGTIINDFGQ